MLVAQVTDNAGARGLIRALRDRPDGALLDLRVAVAACFFVVIGGQSTTGRLISTVLRTAAGNPEAWARASAEDGFARAWVEEVVRREPPITTWRRITREEVELSGVTVPAGAGLLLMLMGTGSDPEVFADPDHLCPYRSNVRQNLSFGAGPHRCPGARPALAEAEVALREAATVLPRAQLEKDAPPSTLGLLSFRAPLRVVVRLRSANRKSPGPPS
ncbi:cytochrome P450 [Streptomyces sp. NPDC060064]|uniref:cytochrome P450 n=1 Tax=Streptomyces sp. NPDC060064 TaxID=3347049 RepID=UPI0036CF8149